MIAVWAVLAAVLPAGLRAAWLENVPVPVRQPDGREFAAYMTGDEYFNWLHDRDGFPLLKEPGSGWYVYARREGSTLAATTLRAGSTDPAAAGLTPGVPVAAAKLEEARRKHWQAPGLTTRIAAQSAPKSGVMENLVVFVRCSDDPEFTDAASLYAASFNGSGAGVNSVYAYFYEISYQQLSVHSRFFPQPGSTIVSWLDTHPRGYYKPRSDDPLGYADESERTSREQLLIRNALEAVKSQIPASLQLDGDGDGLIDNIVIIVQGTPSAWNTLFWPHAWALYQYAVTINGKRAYSYSLQLQSFVSNGSTHTLVHELLHTIGFPDLYHYSYDGLHPVGVWDIMASPTAPPQHPGAWCKYKYGHWIADLPEITGNAACTLNPLTSRTGNACRIPAPADPGGGEFFVAEYRRREGSIFESALPGEGLLLYRIDQRDPAHEGDAALPDEVYIYRPHGTLADNGTLWEATFSAGSGRTVCNDGTSPAPFFADGSASHLDLYDVGAAGATISFSLAREAPDAPLLVYPADRAQDTPCAVILSWQAAAGAQSYQLQLAADSGFTARMVDASGVAQLSWPVSGLSEAATYFWRLRAANSSGAGAWSPAWQFTTSPPDQLPVELLSFTAAAQAEGIALAWVTATETENFGFDIERRCGEEEAWHKIGFIEGHGNSSSRQSYRYLDPLRVAGTYGYRLRQIDFDGTTFYHPEQVASWTQPRDFGLGQNYPNPFNPVTTIAYHLAASAEIDLSVFNSRGQLVQQLVQGTQESGDHQVRWEGCDAAGHPVAGGVYHYILRCGSRSERRAMLLLR